MNRTRQTKSLLRFLFACVASFAVLTVCSKSSFLYPMNDWVDVNCYFTVGRGVLHGLVPYRDLYEQKGPLIYYVYALASLISENSFLGVFLLEGLSFACFVYLGGRIAETLTGWEKAFWPSAAELAILVPITPAFSHGSSAEEFFLPVLALGLFLVLKFLHDKHPLTDRHGFVLGLCAAAALWTKYTFCGLFAGLSLTVLLWYLCRKEAIKLIRLIGFFMLGVLALSAVVIGWFSFQGALSDLWQTYFVDNLSHYSQNIRGGAYDPPLMNLLNNLPWSIPGALGLLWLTATAKKQGWEALATWCGAIFLFAFTYANGRRYPYYALVLSVFAPLGLGAVCALLKLLKGKIGWLFPTVLTILLIVASPYIAYRTSGNTYLMNVEKEDMPPYRFAEIIKQSEDRSLLNYGFLDGGFYLAAETQPTERFFCTLNNDLKEMNEAQQSSIQEGKTAFVVTRMRKLKDSNAYQLVDEASMAFEGMTWKYYLYQRVGSNQAQDSSSASK